MSSSETTQIILGLTAKIVSAYVSRNPLPTADLPVLVSSVHSALVGGPQGRAMERPKAMEPRAALVPAVPIKKSVTPNYIICLEDGRKFKTLKRHLKAAYGLTPEQYREKW